MKSQILLKAIVSWQVIFSILHDVTTFEVSNNAENCKKLQNGICMLHSYDKQQIPSMPITIKVSISILTLTEIDDKLATVEFLSYVILTWQDPRLLKISDDNIIDQVTLLDNNWVLLGEEWANKIWQPDLYITGLKELKLAKFKSSAGMKVFYSILKVLKGHSWVEKFINLIILTAALWVHNTTGNIPLQLNLHQQMRIKFFCEMQFINYPMDVQV